MKNEDKTLLDVYSAACNRYSKIVKMNLTNDSYEIIKAPAAEPQYEKYERTYKLSAWFKGFIASDLIHDDDKEMFEHFSDLDNIINAFAGQPIPYISIHYRRKDNDIYRWAVMDIVKIDEWSADNQVFMGMVRDVHNDYGHEWEYLEALEQINAYDATTGLKSRASYNMVIKRIASSDNHAGVIYCDVNALKHVNDNMGHAAGDMYLKEFADILCSVAGRKNCYRISGDEFVAIMQDIEIEQTLEDITLALRSKKSIITERPIASVGSAYGSSCDIHNTIKLAEKSMYDNKKVFYAAYPGLKR